MKIYKELDLLLSSAAESKVGLTWNEKDNLNLEYLRKHNFLRKYEGNYCITIEGLIFHNKGGYRGMKISSITKTILQSLFWLANILTLCFSIYLYKSTNNKLENTTNNSVNVIDSAYKHINILDSLVLVNSSNIQSLDSIITKED